MLFNKNNFYIPELIILSTRHNILCKIGISKLFLLLKRLQSFSPILASKKRFSHSIKEIVVNIIKLIKASFNIKTCGVVNILIRCFTAPCSIIRCAISLFL